MDETVLSQLKTHLISAEENETTPLPPSDVSNQSPSTKTSTKKPWTRRPAKRTYFDRSNVSLSPPRKPRKLPSAGVCTDLNVRSLRTRHLGVPLSTTIEGTAKRPKCSSRKSSFPKKIKLEFGENDKVLPFSEPDEDDDVVLITFKRCKNISPQSQEEILVSSTVIDIKPVERADKANVVVEIFDQGYTSNMGDCGTLSHRKESIYDALEETSNFLEQQSLFHAETSSTEFVEAGDPCVLNDHCREIIPVDVKSCNLLFGDCSLNSSGDSSELLLPKCAEISEALEKVSSEFDASFNESFAKFCDDISSSSSGESSSVTWNSDCPSTSNSRLSGVCFLCKKSYSDVLSHEWCVHMKQLVHTASGDDFPQLNLTEDDFNDEPSVPLPHVQDLLPQSHIPQRAAPRQFVGLVFIRSPYYPGHILPYARWTDTSGADQFYPMFASTSFLSNYGYGPYPHLPYY